MFYEQNQDCCIYKKKRSADDNPKPYNPDQWSLGIGKQQLKKAITAQ